MTRTADMSSMEAVIFAVDPRTPRPRPRRWFLWFLGF